MNKNNFFFLVSGIKIENLNNEMESNVKITIRFFAKSRELAGVNSAEINLPSEPISSEDLLKNIISTFPKVNQIKQNLILALNDEYISVKDKESLTLKSGDEVSLIPPISGG